MNQQPHSPNQTSEGLGQQVSAAFGKIIDPPIQQDAEKLSGHPTIGAKRVPADILINYLANGRTIHDFLADYDAVTESDVLAVLNVIKQAILDGMLTGLRGGGLR